MSHPRATIAISGRRYDEPFRHRTDRRGSQTARSASTRRARRSHAGHGPHRRRDGDGKGARRATPAPALGTRGADLSLPSRRKRACPVSPIRARLISFTAAKPSKRPSVRCASHTDPIPPCPSGRRRVYWPSVRPARLVAGGPAREASFVGPRLGREEVRERPHELGRLRRKRANPCVPVGAAEVQRPIEQRPEDRPLVGIYLWHSAPCSRPSAHRLRDVTCIRRGGPEGERGPPAAEPVRATLPCEPRGDALSHDADRAGLLEGVAGPEHQLQRDRFRQSLSAGAAEQAGVHVCGADHELRRGPDMRQRVVGQVDASPARCRSATVRRRRPRAPDYPAGRHAASPTPPAAIGRRGSGCDSSLDCCRRHAPE